MRLRKLGHTRETIREDGRYVERSKLGGLTYGLERDTAANRREFERRMKQARLEPRDEELLIRSGWKIGAEDFHDWLADKLAHRGRQGERASERRETDASLAKRMVREALAKARWRERLILQRSRRDTA